MDNKVGRPKIPEERAKRILLGAQYSPPEAKRIDTAVAASPEKDRSKWLRSATLEAAHYWVDGEGWTVADLHGKTVDFEVFMPPDGPVEGPIKGRGKFDVWQNGEGKLKIRIVTHEKELTPFRQDIVRIWLPQEAVKLIKKQPDGAPSDFSISDPLFQKCVRESAKARRI